MEKYVIESWYRMEKVFDNQIEAQKYADLRMSMKEVKDVVFHTLKSGVSRKEEPTHTQEKV